MLIKGSRISITYMTIDMAYDVWQNSLDDNNRRFVPDEVFETLDDATEVVKFIINSYKSVDGPFIYPVIRNEDNANMGYVQLVKINKGWEIGYHIAEKYTNNGYATEALNLYLEYLRGYSNLKEVYGIALMDNKASRRVLAKCGFETIFEGIGPYQGEQKKIVRTIKKL